MKRRIVPGGMLALSFAVVLLAATASTASLIGTPDGLNVLLRHRPFSISEPSSRPQKKRAGLGEPGTTAGRGHNWTIRKSASAALADRGRV